MAPATDLGADAALALILRSVRPLRPRSLPLSRLPGRVLAREIRASGDWPAFDNSAMDGYALRLRDLPGELRVAGRSRAGGSWPRPLRRGEACRIMTGAPLPAGADAVVPRELAREEQGRLLIDGKVERGQHIRRRGQDFRRGDAVLARGRLVRSWEVSVLANQGIAEASAVPTPAVGVLCSGDELVDCRRVPPRGRVRDSNGPALAAQVAAWGFVPVPLGRVRDESGAMAAAFRKAAARVDALLVSGGVSVGDVDHTRRALERAGLKTLFWRARIKPGKPLLFGLLKGRPVFGLPGNPISALACAHVFVRPALDRLAGRALSDPFPLRARLAKSFAKPRALRQYLFCRRRGARLEVLVPQGSGFVGMGGRAEALAVGPEGLSRLEAGREVRFNWLS